MPRLLQDVATQLAAARALAPSPIGALNA